MAGAYNALTARQAARAGFRAVYVSGAGLANATAGVPDIGLLSRDEVTLLAGWIARAVDVPVLVDADTGFGDAAAVARTVRRFEDRGVAGLHIEDQVFPKRCGHVGGKEVVPAAEMIRKIRSAVRARRDADFLIVARTDARAVEGLDAAIDRARRYVDAGADAIFPEALQTRGEFATFARRVEAPLLANMTEFGRGPLLTVRELADMGYRMVIFPQTALRVAMRAQEAALRDLARRGTQRRFLRRMQTRQALYDLLDYDPTKEWVGRNGWPAQDRARTRR
jgi:methylisocitrate lyase